MKKILSLLVAVAFMAMSAAAFADWTRTSFVTDTKTQSMGQFQIDGFFSYATKDKYADAKIDGKFTELDANIEYGIMDNWNVSATWGWEKVKMDEVDYDESGMKDIWVDTKYLLLNEASSYVDLALGAGIKIPVADKDDGLGTEEVDYRIFASVAKTLVPELILVANLNYTFNTDPTYDGVKYDLKNSFGWGAELIYNGLVEKLSLHAAVWGWEDAERDAVDDLKSPILFGIGAKYYFTDALRAGLDLVMGGDADKSAAPDFAIEASVGVLL